MSRVGGPLSCGGHLACAVQNALTTCWDFTDAGRGLTYGPAAAWLSHTTEGGARLGIRLDGSVVVATPTGGDATVAAASGSPWVSARYQDSNSVVVTDSAGFSYDLNALEAGPLLPEPTTMMDVASDGLCGVTFDGRMQCTTDYAEVYPPPGSFVVGL